MAKEYIDKNLTWKALDVAHLFDNGNPRHIAQQVIEEQPTADVVEVVRCHNCEYHGTRDKCPLLNMSPYRDDERGYCSEGKRLE